MRDLIDNVIRWAADRNILEGSTASKQLDKTSEELNELQRALGQVTLLEQFGLQDSLSVAYIQARNELRDAYGDVLVTLIISGNMVGVDIESALAEAWDVIKDRKGRMISGKFVKESDL